MSSPAPAAESTRPRSTIHRVVLTSVTVLWLLALVLATVRQTDALYPVTSYSMFSYPTGGLNVQFELTGTTAAGRPVLLSAEDLGLTELQLRGFLADNVGSHPDRRRPEATASIAAVADAWSDRHDAELSKLSVVRVEHSVQRANPVRTPVEEWER